MRKVSFVLPLDYGVLRNDKHENHFIFRDKEGKSKMDYNFYLGEFVIDNNKQINENQFIIHLNEEDKLSFTINVFDNGKVTESKDTDIDSETLFIDPINNYNFEENKTINIMANNDSYDEELIKKYNSKYADVAYLINSVVEREMINLNNSSFYLTDYGYSVLSDYINNIYLLYLDWKKENKEEIINQKQYKFFVKRFLTTDTIEKFILDARNRFNFKYAMFRLEELERVINNKRFFAKNSHLFLEKKLSQGSLDQSRQMEYKKMYEYYKNIPFLKRTIILRNYYFGKETNANYDLEALSEVDFQLKNNKKAFLELIDNDNNTNNRQAGFEADINNFYIKNRGILFPDRGSVEDFDKIERNDFLINKYNEEYNHYLFLLKEDIQEKSKEFLSEFYELSLLNDLDDINQLIEGLLQEQLVIKSKNTDKDPIFEEILLDIKDIDRANIDETLNASQSINKHIKKFYENSLILYHLEKLQITHPDNMFLNGHITPSRFQSNKIEIAGEKDLPGFVVDSNMIISSYMIERGKGLFGLSNINNKKTIMDKYEFYQFFNDIEKVKEYLKKLYTKKKVLIDVMLEEQDDYKNATSEDDKKKIIKKIAHSSNTLNLVNQKIEFLIDYISIQKIETSGSMEEYYEDLIDKTFIDSKKFKDSYIETYKRYRQVGRLVRESKDSIENYRLKGDFDKMKSAEKSLKKLIKANMILSNYLSRKHENLQSYINILKQAILKEDIELINNINIKLSNFEKNMLKQLILQEKIEHGLVMNNLKGLSDNVIEILDDQDNISLLDNISELLSYKYISRELYYNIIETLEYKIANTTNEAHLKELKHKLKLYKEEDFEALKLVVNDINLYYVEAYGHGDIHKRLKNLIESEVERGWMNPYTLMDTIIKEYDLRINSKEYIQEAMKTLGLKYSLDQAKDMDFDILANTFKKQYQEFSNFSSALVKGINAANAGMTREEVIQSISEARAKLLFKDALMIRAYNEVKDLRDSQLLAKKLRDLNSNVQKVINVIDEGIHALDVCIANGYSFESNKTDTIKQMAVIHLKKSLLEEIDLKEEPEVINTETLAINDNKKVYLYLDGKYILKSAPKIKKSDLTKYDIASEL